ncbi:copper resistance protein CopC [soil metagenome]
MFLLAVVALAVVLAPPGDRAAAQGADLESSDPADGSTVSRSPEQLVLNFTEPLGSTNSVAVACNSNPVPSIGRPEVSDDELTLTVRVVRALPMGPCTVSWRVSEPDGNPGANGSFTFEVESAPVTTASTPDTGENGGTTPGTGTDGTAATAPADDSDDSSSATELAPIGTFGSDWGLWLGRMLSIGGIAVAFGALVLIAVAWPEGPEYIIAVRFIRTAWIVGLVGTVIYVAAASASSTGESLASSLNPVDWSDLLDAGWPGRAVLARLLLVVAMGWVAFLPERVVESTTQIVGLGIPALAVATIGLTRTGGDLAALGIAMAVLHALAMAVWLGGAVFVARIVLAGSGDEDLVHAVRGFSRLSLPALLITVITGLVQLFRLDGGELFSTGHGRVLLGKSVAVAIVLFVAVAARQAVLMRLGRARELEAPAANRLRRAYGVDALLGIVVLGLTGWMLTYPPSNIDAFETGEYQIVETVTDEELGVEISVSLRPGRVGSNELLVEVRQPDEGLRGLELTFVPPEGSTVSQISQAIPLTGRGVAVSARGDGIPLGESGSWRLQINASTAEGSLRGASNTFDLREADGSLPDSQIDSGTTPPTAAGDGTDPTNASTAPDTDGG